MVELLESRFYISSFGKKDIWIKLSHSSNEVIFTCIVPRYKSGSNLFKYAKVISREVVANNFPINPIP